MNGLVKRIFRLKETCGQCSGAGGINLVRGPWLAPPGFFPFNRSTTPLSAIFSYYNPFFLDYILIILH